MDWNLSVRLTQIWSVNLVKVLPHAVCVVLCQNVEHLPIPFNDVAV